MKSEKKFRLSIYLIFFLASLMIFRMTPYCHDEWQWGLPERMELMKSGFQNYNGRYLGNLLALVITRNQWAKAFVMAGVMLMLLWILCRIGESTGCGEPVKSEQWGQLGETQGITLLLFGIILLFAVPDTLYAQSYGWSAAFVNFAPPVLLFLIFFYKTESAYSDWQEQESSSVPCCILFAVLCFASQLFSEHNTLFHIGYAGWLILYCLYRYKRIDPLHFTALCSYIAGAVVMFSNGAYRRAAEHTDGYKTISFHLNDLLSGYAENICSNILLVNRVLIVLLTGTLLFCLYRRGKRDMFTAWTVFILSGYTFYAIWQKVDPGWHFFGNSQNDGYMRMVLTIVYVIHVLVVIWKTVPPETRMSICVLIVSAFAGSMPLLAADPIGMRCFYVSYVLEAAAVLKLLALSKSKVQAAFLKNILIGTVAFGLLAVYLWMFRDVDRYVKAREQAVIEAAANQAASVSLPYLPHSRHFWITVPPNETWEKRFKEFYGIPQKMKLNWYDPT